MNKTTNAIWGGGSCNMVYPFIQLLKGLKS